MDLLRRRRQPPEDAVYPVAEIDGDGKPLNGANKYSLHFTKVEIPPVDAFWSLTMYDDDAYLVANPINRYALGDRSHLAFDADGGLTLYIQSDSPGKDKESNWLPAPQNAGFKLALRLMRRRRQSPTARGRLHRSSARADDNELSSATSLEAHRLIVAIDVTIWEEPPSRGCGPLNRPNSAWNPTVHDGRCTTRVTAVRSTERWAILVV